ncbi:MAG TPA: hypothetical protein PLU17_05090 [Chitinophagaceae bacterium]|nr:hypothetical protein [Chitinophagaceae bacterium]HPI54347.1 hypothetical protein [Chitinophagaceae bacterium]
MSNNIKIEPLEEDELLFLKKRLDAESKEYMFAMNMLLRAAVIIPFVVAIVTYIRFEDSHLMLTSFLYALVISIIILSIAGIASYMRGLYHLKKDIKIKSKIVESCLITEKKYMALNHTWHFYLTSYIKLSIEVSELDFDRFEVNDEINIEYASFTKTYFGFH